jgi:hypothetical protein
MKMREVDKIFLYRVMNRCWMRSVALRGSVGFGWLTRRYRVAVLTSSKLLTLQIRGGDCFDFDQETVMELAARNDGPSGAIVTKNP